MWFSAAATPDSSGKFRKGSSLETIATPIEAECGCGRCIGERAKRNGAYFKSAGQALIETRDWRLLQPADRRSTSHRKLSGANRDPGCAEKRPRCAQSSVFDQATVQRRSQQLRGELRLVP